MKNNKFCIVWLLPILFVVIGCTKASINGDLDGRWQLLNIDTEENSMDVKADQLYYNFYMHVCALSRYGEYFTEGNMIYDGQTLYMDFPYISTEVGLKKLEEFGIYSNPVKFKVLEINSKRLILQEDKITITFRKF